MPSILVQNYGTGQYISSPMLFIIGIKRYRQGEGIPVASCATNLILSLGQDGIILWIKLLKKKLIKYDCILDSNDFAPIPEHSV